MRTPAWCRRLTQVAMAAGLGYLFQGCPVQSLVNTVSDCFTPNSLSADEFEDLNFLAQLGYEKNDCGRYVPRDNFFGDLF